MTTKDSLLTDSLIIQIGYYLHNTELKDLTDSELFELATNAFPLIEAITKELDCRRPGRVSSPTTEVRGLSHTCFKS